MVPQVTGCHGLLLVIVASFIHARPDGVMDTTLDAVGILGSILVIASIAGVFPLSIWGFIKGFREGRANQA